MALFTLGASAIGVETLQRLVKLLPAELPASIFLVLHIPKGS
jgi:chemotaxis response regulator CheB